MKKFNRVYQLKGEVSQGVTFTSPLSNPNQINANVTVELPYTVEFEISRANLSSSQTGDFRLFNLAPEIRDAIKKDIYNIDQIRAVQFWAGYSNDDSHTQPLIFNGTINQAFSQRVGQDWITTIQAFDGGFQMANGYGVAQTVTAGLESQDAIRQLAGTLPGMSAAPIVGNFPTANKRGEVFFGNVWDLILKKSNGLATIDNGQVKALNYNECFAGGLPEINDASGVIGTPRVSGVTIEFEMIFEPGLTVGQIIRLNLSATPTLNRQWKVLGFEHHGKITDSGSAGEAVTTVRLWYSPQSLTIVPGSPFLAPISIAA